MLVAPLSYFEMVVGSLSTVVLRASITGLGILLMGLCFGASSIESWPLFIFWVVAVATVFGLAGILIGLWSKSFEQPQHAGVVVLPDAAVDGGRRLNTVAMLPDWLRWLAWANPFFYFINGIRGAMIGVDETPPGLGIGLTLLLIVALGGTVWRLYSVVMDYGNSAVLLRRGSVACAHVLAYAPRDAPAHATKSLALGSPRRSE